MSFHSVPFPPDSTMPRNALNDPYAASCNPPRQAKRLRSNSITTSPQVLPVSLAPKKPLPQNSSFTLSVAKPTSDTSPTPNRRGRKPNTSSRAAREAQRKMNHSIIEKARRTKINDALATLRTLVPPQYVQRCQNREGDDNEDELQEDDKGKKPGEEKEFKLDILVRTVSFLQDLTERVKDLEQRECSKCGGSAPSTSQIGHKRKQDLVEEEEEGPLHRTQTRSQASDSSAPTSSTSLRLPSIASWLPTSIDAAQSLLQDKESTRLSTSPRQSYLPSPPNSTHMRPSITTQVPAILALSAPSTGTGSAASSHRESFSRTPTMTSPLLSPGLRSADDESAASTLLNISSLSYRPLPPPPKDKERNRKAFNAHSSVQPSTPSSLLGIGGD